VKLPIVDSKIRGNDIPGPDCVLFTAPFSPTDSGPPLGPAILRGLAAQSGYDVRCVDSNVRYLNLFREGRMLITPFVGDQDKDQVTNRRAREHFRRSLCLDHISPEIIADSVDAVMGLQCSFEEIENALDQMIDEGFWVEFLEEHLFAAFEQPRVMGLSLMGPAQVMVALLAARLCRAWWPQTAIIAGGSHITLLTERIEADSRYGIDIDAFLPGHSEHTFVNLLGMEPPFYDIPGVLVSGMTYMPTCPLPPSEWEPPSFEESELHHYPIERLTLPIQLRRGCSYGKCTYCTYPKVEELTRNEITEMAHRLLPSLLQHAPERISVKDSLFDLKAMREFAEVMAEIAPGVAWSCTTKLVRGMRKESMRELYDKGLRTVEFGIESIHEHTQRLFNKVQPVDRVETVVDGACEAGITVVLNLIYGAPGETHEDAVSQLEWFLKMSERWPLKILGSHNLLEVNLGSPLAEMERLEASITGPWAFSMAWDAPDWRPQFHSEMERMGLISPIFPDEKTSWSAPFRYLLMWSRYQGK
jgi:hypothetical protein